jgi:uncharacterized protein
MNRAIRTIVLLASTAAASPVLLFSQASSISPETATHQQSVPAISPGDQATAEQLARLFDVMRIRDQMQTTRRIIPSLVETQVRQQMEGMSADLPPGSKLTAEQRTQMDQLLRKYMAKAMDMYPVDEMLADMTGLYQKHLTRDDIAAMTTFYASPAGQHLLDAQPKIAQEYMPLVMQRTAERTKTLTAEMMKDLAALKQSASPTRPASK